MQPRVGFAKRVELEQLPKQLTTNQWLGAFEGLHKAGTQRLIGFPLSTLADVKVILLGPGVPSPFVSAAEGGNSLAFSNVLLLLVL